jgi:hypothetical protein
MQPKDIDDKFAAIILSLEEAIFNLEDLLENHDFSEKEISDLITTKELAQSSRDMTIAIIASKNNKKVPNINHLKIKK